MGILTVEHSRVPYERARGKRATHQTRGSESRTKRNGWDKEHGLMSRSPVGAAVKAFIDDTRVQGEQTYFPF
jgi:hypothetical protein